MLQKANTYRKKKSPRLHCSKCCRMEYHHLCLGTDDMKRFLSIITLGTISWFGLYRCVCCGKGRIGKIDGLRRKMLDRASNGKKTSNLNPIDLWLDYRDSWEQRQRRRNSADRMRRITSKKSSDYKPFRKRTW